MNKQCFLLIFVFNVSFGFSQVKDIDGNVYKTIQVGTQRWLTKNLEVTTFRNGDPIPHIQDFDQWMDAGMAEEPAWCYYHNKTENGEEYGKLYNWYAVIDPRGIAPIGWHVSSSSEWLELIEMLGGEEQAAIKLKSVSLWKPARYIENPHCNGNNISRLNIKPSGGRFSEAYIDHFSRLGHVAYFWIPETSVSEYDAMSFNICASGSMSINENYRKIGMAVRCVEDIKTAQLDK